MRFAASVAETTPRIDNTALLTSDRQPTIGRRANKRERYHHPDGIRPQTDQRMDGVSGGGGGVVLGSRDGSFFV